MRFLAAMTLKISALPPLVLPSLRIRRHSLVGLPVQPYSVTTPGDFVPAHSVPDVLVSAASYLRGQDLQYTLGPAGYAGTCRLSWGLQTLMGLGG